MGWSYPGSPHYLDKQAARFKAPLELAKISRDNVEIYKVQTLLAQVSDRCKKAPVDAAGKPIFGKQDRDGIAGTLAMVERYAIRLHILAGGAHAMLADAYRETGIAPAAKRTFEIFCDHDVAPAPVPVVETSDETIDDGETEGA